MSFEPGPDGVFGPTVNDGRTFTEIEHHGGGENTRIIHQIRDDIHHVIEGLSSAFHEMEPLEVGEKWTIPIRISCGFAADIEIRVRAVGACRRRDQGSVAKRRRDYMGREVEVQPDATAEDFLIRIEQGGLVVVKGFQIGPETIDNLVRQERERAAAPPSGDTAEGMEIRPGMRVTPEQAERLISAVFSDLEAVSEDRIESVLDGVTPEDEEGDARE